MTKRLDAINKPAIHSLIVNFSGIDENFHENVKNAIEAGFDVGVYVYSQVINEEEALEEAELVLNEIKDYEITLPIVYDP